MTLWHYFVRDRSTLRRARHRAQISAAYHHQPLRMAAISRELRSVIELQDRAINNPASE